MKWIVKSIDITSIFKIEVFISKMCQALQNKHLIELDVEKTHSAKRLTLVFTISCVVELCFDGNKGQQNNCFNHTIVIWHHLTHQRRWRKLIRRIDWRHLVKNGSQISKKGNHRSRISLQKHETRNHKRFSCNGWRLI